MKTPRPISLLSLRVLLALAAAFVLAAAPRARAEEKTLLSPDGTLFDLRSGTAADLGFAGAGVRPDDNVVEWSYLRQDGTKGFGLVPGTTGSSLKENLDLVYDVPTGALAVLWKEEVPLLNILHLGVLRGDQWNVTDLLPNVGFPAAYNPQMLLSHPVVHSLDSAGHDVWTTQSLLSVIWWEENSVSQARYAPIFLNEDFTQSDVVVYDLPATIGGGGPTSADGIPMGAYRYPALALDGPSGGILASFADLNGSRQCVVRVGFPTDIGLPGPNNPTAVRRHIPIVGITSSEPLSMAAPADGSVEVFTYIGTGYHPTFAWQDGTAVRFVRFDGTAWSTVNSVATTPDLPLDKALRLVQDMATKN